MTTDSARRTAAHIESLVSPFRRRASMRVDEALTRLRSVETAAQTAQHDLVGAMRDAGWSWSAIAECLGTSKQAAQQRFGGRPQRTTATEDPEQMTLP